MSKSENDQIQEIKRLRAALEAVSGKEPSPSTVKKRGMKGRHYNPSEKKAILKEAAEGVSLKVLREKYGICRETLRRWQRREAARAPSEPIASGDPKSSIEASAPSVTKDRHDGDHPHWREVLRVWRSRPGLGPAQIRNQLYRDKIKINVATVRKIMEENGYTPPKTTVKEVETHRYEAARPLELVHMDFKHFYISKQKVYLLLLQDDFSRFLCGYKMTDSENMKSVIEAFEECVNRYGKMQTVMTDAGSAFYSWNGINKFQKLMSDEYGVDQIKANSPRSNGKIENVNKQIEKEVLNVEHYASLMEADAAIGEWIQFYNFERTHMGLPAGLVPADRFLPGWNCKLSGGVTAQNQPTSQPVAVLPEKTNREVMMWEDILRLAIEKLKRAA